MNWPMIECCVFFFLFEETRFDDEIRMNELERKLMSEIIFVVKKSIKKDYCLTKIVTGRKNGLCDPAFVLCHCPFINPNQTENQT
jgi:hypothetical protein